MKAGENALLTFTLGESSTNFNADDVTVTGGTLADFTGSGAVYTATFVPTTGFTGTGTVSVAAGTFTDAAGNGNTRGTLSPSLAIDTNPPTIAITSNLATLKVGTTALVTFRLSEASKDFTADDVTVTGGSLSNFTGSGTTYTAKFTPTPDLVGVGTISTASGVFTDAAGNPNVAGSLATALVIDLIAPTITITADKAALKTGDTSLITFSLAETPANFAAWMVTVTGGSLSNFTGSGTTYTARFTPSANFTGTATVTVAAGRFTDAAGNGNISGSLLGGMTIVK